MYSYECKAKFISIATDEAKGEWKKRQDIIQLSNKTDNSV